MAQKLFQSDRIDLSLWAGLLLPADCTQLLEIGRESLREATVSEEESGIQRVDQGRISQMAWPPRERYPILQRIAEGIAQLTEFPIACQEPLQILRYPSGGEYKPHFDGFHAESPELRLGGNRVWTLILYLNAVEGGGETVFPELGITVYPLMGGGVLFRNLTAEGVREPLSLHAGNPVAHGEKWIATQWIRQRDYVTPAE